VRKSLALAGLALALCIAWVSRAEGPAVDAALEARKIEYLIGSVAALSNAVFVRNGSEYGAAAAADHLRTKLRAAGGHVVTADDFIRLCATRSSLSGEAYQIRYGDGRVVSSEAFLRERLAAWHE
jgi:hypothetical protein